jgi:hypothetical protein
MLGHLIDQQVVYPTYGRSNACPNPTIDVALMHLASPITDIPPVALPAAGDPPPAPGTTCTAIGYGANLQGSVQTLQAKRTATSTITSVSTQDIFVSEGTGIADSGDSGGPLVCNGFLVGTVACHADGQTGDHTTEHYVLVGAALDWIQQTLAAWEQGSSGSPEAGTPEDAGEADSSTCATDLASCTLAGTAPSNGLCSGGACAPCTSEEDAACQSAYGDSSTPWLCVAGACVTGDCHADADCPAGEICGVGSANLCGPCEADGDCQADPSYGPNTTCNSSNGTCQ